MRKVAANLFFHERAVEFSSDPAANLARRGELDILIPETDVK